MYPLTNHVIVLGVTLLAKTRKSEPSPNGTNRGSVRVFGLSGEVVSIKAAVFCDTAASFVVWAQILPFAGFSKTALFFGFQSSSSRVPAFLCSIQKKDICIYNNQCFLMRNTPAPSICTKKWAKNNIQLFPFLTWSFPANPRLWSLLNTNIQKLFWKV